MILFNAKTRKKFLTGFTLVEMLFVLAIFGIIVSIVLYNFSGQRSAQALNNSEDEVVALLNEARSRTLSGEGRIQYGVHFESGKAVLFSSAYYSSGASDNRPVVFDSSVAMSSLSLFPTGTEIVFQKLTGEAVPFGTITLQNISSTSSQKIITVTKPGFVSGN